MPAGSVPDVLYHYASADGLMGILDTGVIWASDVQLMNDRNETLIGAEIIEEELGDLDEGNALTSYNRNKKSDTRYAACFSEKSDRLEMWSGYGIDGGYSIGFRTEALTNAVPSTMEWAGKPRIWKVLYDEDEFRTSIRAERPVDDDDERRPSGPDLFARAALLKGTEWSYEQEWRAADFT